MNTIPEDLRSLNDRTAFTAAQQIEFLTGALERIWLASQEQVLANKLESIAMGAARRHARTILDKVGSDVSAPKAEATDGDVLGCLELLVKHGTEHRGESLVLCYDEEDGFFLSTVETGTRHHPVKDLTGAKRDTLADAIVAAAHWHNKQGEKHYMSHLLPIAVDFKAPQ